MIKINLTPIEELENPYWWAPDVSIFALIFIVSFGGVYIYLDFTRDEIQSIKTNRSMMETEIQNLQPDIDRFNELNEKIAKLESKKRSLQRITESKLVRYLPVILLENLQTLKPEGMWFRKIQFVDAQNENVGQGINSLQSADSISDPVENENSQGSESLQTRGLTQGSSANGTNLAEIQGQEYPVEIELIGQAYSNIVVAEFMGALKSTQSQPYESSDVRTQLFFSNVSLSFSEISSSQQPTENSQSVVEFRLVLKFKEREQEGSDMDARLTRFIQDFKDNGQATMRF